MMHLEKQQVITLVSLFIASSFHKEMNKKFSWINKILQ